MSLLTMIQDVADELTLPRPSAIIGSSDQTARTMLAHAKREGETLVRMHDWTILQTVHTFTLSDGTAEYALPSDYDRLITNTEWDRAQSWPLIGPLDGVDWQRLKSSNLGTGLISTRYRIVKASSGNDRKFTIDPTPGADEDGNTFAYEYISKNYCANSGGTAQSAWADDTDVPILDESLMKLGIKVRYLNGRGLDSTTESQEYYDLYHTLKGQDRPSGDLSLVARTNLRLLNYFNIPETGYGV